MEPEVIAALLGSVTTIGGIILSHYFTRRTDAKKEEKLEAKRNEDKQINAKKIEKLEAEINESQARTHLLDEMARIKAEERAQQEAKAAKEEPALSKGISANWQKVASLFWLGNDLMWMQDAMIRGALPERVLQGLRCVEMYLENLGLNENTFLKLQLKNSRTTLESLEGIKDLTPENVTTLRGHYQNVYEYVEKVKWFLHALLVEQEPGFEKCRAL